MVEEGEGAWLAVHVELRLRWRSAGGGGAAEGFCCLAQGHP